MKFTKKYEVYMQGDREKGLPLVGLKNLKKMLKACRMEIEAQQGQQRVKKVEEELEGGSVIAGSSDSVAIAESSSTCDNNCTGYCPVCDGTFFPSLLQEMSAVVGCFNQRAKKLLEMHLASGLKKYVLWFVNKSQLSYDSLSQEGKDLVTYAIINSIAMRKILKKYDKASVFSFLGMSSLRKLQLRIRVIQNPNVNTGICVGL